MLQHAFISFLGRYITAVLFPTTPQQLTPSDAGGTPACHCSLRRRNGCHSHSLSFSLPLPLSVVLAPTPALSCSRSPLLFYGMFVCARVCVHSYTHTHSFTTLTPSPMLAHSLTATPSLLGRLFLVVAYLCDGV